MATDLGTFVWPYPSGTSTLPTGAATSANQVLEIAALNSIDGKTLTAGQKTMANSYPVVIASDQSALPITVASLPLPSGAATSALQTTGNTSLASIDTKTPALGQALAASSTPVVLTAAQITTLTPLTSVTANIGTTNGLALDASVTGLQVSQGSTTSGQKGGLVLGAVTTAAPSYTTAQSSPLSLTTGGALRVDASSSTQPISGTVAISQVTPGTTNGVQVVAAIPAGANIIGALTANQSVNVAQINGVTPLMGNGTTGTGSQRVTIASDNTAFSVNAVQSGTWTVQPGNTANTTAWLVNQSGRLTANTSSYNDYSSVNVTTSAYVQLVASTTSATGEIEIFDSSGQGMIIATGAAASEVDQIYIFPGGNGRVPLKIAASTRVSIKAKTATASAGYIMINYYA